MLYVDILQNYIDFPNKKVSIGEFAFHYRIFIIIGLALILIYE